MFSLRDHEFLLCFVLFCSFPEKYCFHIVSQELLLDICTIALFQLSAKALFYFLKQSKKILNQTHADRQICFIFVGKTQWKQRSPGWPGLGEGTEAEGAEAPSQADANNALSEAHNEPIENTELFGKIPNCEKYVHVAVESQVGTSDTSTYFFFKCTFLLQIQRQGTIIIP